ncbi:hypothetical protein PI124_g10770 [Phytophthora idaei]|nr:hypothetical protein PI125_g8435 [Phytophthora idaei]KAG3156601.1 hypothetical protein PI126_g8716 [Phytophthora idaei]KAG3244445.1 hypothetical protein PI124_g10770 [Phytophthora idaei]
MRLFHVLVLPVAYFLIASEAFSMTTDSNQISNVAPPTNPSQRLLRVPHIAIQVDADSEERSLTLKEMKKMMKKLTTKEAYAG